MDNGIQRGEGEKMRTVNEENKDLTEIAGRPGEDEKRGK